MNFILFDAEIRDHLLPLTYTRPCAELRVGIMTIREKWEHVLGAEVSHITQDYLSRKYPLTVTDDNVIINGTLLPDPMLKRQICDLAMDEALLDGDKLVAARLTGEQFNKLVNEQDIDQLQGFNYEEPYVGLERPHDIFTYNGKAIEADFERLTKGRTSHPLSDTNTVIGDPSRIFLEAGARVECAILNTQNGPIYVGRDAEIMEGCIVRGGLAMCEHSVLKLGAKVYGPTTLGPYCKVGGEVNNCVFQAYSNKGHDGFMGNSVIGEWCNIGADSNTSNLKNNYAEVKLWDYVNRRFMPTGLQFCGLIMGDHSKCGINTMFNTGTVVGVSCNIYGAGFPRNYVPSFMWGGAAGTKEYRFDKAMETAEIMMKRRNIDLDGTEREMLTAVFEQTQEHRPKRS